MNGRRKSTFLSIVALSLSTILMLSACTGGGNSSSEGNGDSADKSSSSSKMEFDKEKETGDEKIKQVDIDLEPSEGFRKGGDLKISGYFDPPPALSGSQYVATAGYPGNMEEFTNVKLFDYVPLPNKVFIPWLGKSFKQEGKVTTIELDLNYKWSDGTPVTAKDVLCTFNMKFLFNDQVWKYLEDVKAIDDKTIELTWKVDGQYLLVMASGFYIDSSYAEYGKWADKADEFKTKRTFNAEKGEYETPKDVNDAMLNIREDVFTYLPDITKVLTNSMYKVTSVNASDMIAERNEHYPYQDKVAFDKIILQRYVSAEAWLSTVMAGGYDIEPHGTTPDLFKQLEKNNPEMKTMWTPDLGQPVFQFNFQKYPMNIPEVRKAIAYAIDRDQLVPIAEPGTNPGDDYITGMTPKWRDVFLTEELKAELVDYSYDPVKAEEMLISIGWTKGDKGWQNEKGEVVEIEISAMNSWPIFLICGDAVTNMLKDFGFKAKFNAMELSSYWTYIDNGDAMISADFRGGSHTFGYWESYKNSYIDAGRRVGFVEDDILAEDPNAPVILKDAKGAEYNMRKLVADMFASADNAGAKEAVEAAMKVTNNEVPLIPFGEKWSPIKIHNPKITGYPEDSMNDPRWYCPANMVGVVRLLRHGQIYYAE